MIALVLAADLFTTLLLGDRSEARLRVAEGPNAGFDLATTPSIRLDMRNRRMDFSVGYAPSFTLADLQASVSPQVYQMADASISFIARRTTLAVSTSASYGDFNFAYLLPTSSPSVTPPPPQLVPGATTIRYGSTRTGASLRRTWRRLAVSISGGHSVAGGLDGPSRQVVPLISSPHAEAAVDYDASRRDLVSTIGTATLASSTLRLCDPTTGGPPTNVSSGSCTPNQEWAELREAWRHAFSRLTSLTLSAGAVAVRSQLNPGATDSYSVVPTGQIAVAHDFGVGRPWRSLWDVGARVAPMIDIRYALVEPRLELASTWTLARGRTSVATKLAFVRSLPPTNIDATYLTFAVEGLRQLDKRFDMGLGTRGVWQHDAVTSSYFIVGVYVAFVWHEPRIRL